MALSLNHFSIRTTDLNASRRFYADVLGLTVGPRPDDEGPDRQDSRSEASRGWGSVMARIPSIGSSRVLADRPLLPPA